jgi:hypothetical protein
MIFTSWARRRLPKVLFQVSLFIKVAHKEKGGENNRCRRLFLCGLFDFN